MTLAFLLAPVVFAKEVFAPVRFTHAAAFAVFRLFAGSIDTIMLIWAGLVIWVVRPLGSGAP